MVKRWLLYVAVWACCLAFYVFYKEWFSYILLIAITALPWLSLLLSLPVVLSAKLQIHMPREVPRGTFIKANAFLRSPFPLPQWRMRITARHLLWGKDWLLQPGGDFPTEHCGTLTCKCSQYWMFDYLGLFCIPKRPPKPFRVSVMPIPEQPMPPPDVDSYLTQAWRPKAGGGFSENHELRLYRPGDHLKQIHWKLSAKTGKLIFREAMVPQGGRMLVWLHHCGSPEALDRKLGQLLYVSSYLRRLELNHDVLVFTFLGPRIWHIGTEHTVMDVLRELMATPPMVTADDSTPAGVAAVWQYYIGGDEHEKV
jgi:hypothetical protein